MTTKRLLVVDDSVSVTRLLKVKLEDTGLYVVREVNDSSSVLDAAGEFRPDLIFLDIMMPGKGGEEISAELRADESLSHIPIVFLTAMVTTEEAGTHGGQTFLAKPVQIKAVLAYLKEHLG